MQANLTRRGTGRPPRVAPRLIRKRWAPPPRQALTQLEGARAPGRATDSRVSRELGLAALDVLGGGPTDPLTETDSGPCSSDEGCGKTLGGFEARFALCSIQRSLRSGSPNGGRSDERMA